MNTGYIKREYPSIEVLRGLDFQNPTKQTLALPVEKDTDGAPIAIYSGMVISQTTQTADQTSRPVWTKGVPADTTPAIIGFAYTDSDQGDSVTADSFLGILRKGDFRLRTPFFCREKLATGEETANTVYNYTVGTELAAAEAEDTFVKYDTAGNAVEHLGLGWLRPAGTGDTVIGVIVQEGTAANKAIDLRPSYQTATNSNCKRENSYVVVFDTV